MATTKKKKAKTNSHECGTVIIEISGGMVQAIRTDRHIVAVVYDWDNIKDDGGEPEEFFLKQKKRETIKKIKSGLDKTASKYLE